MAPRGASARALAEDGAWDITVYEAPAPLTFAAWLSRRLERSSGAQAGARGGKRLATSSRAHTYPYRAPPVATTASTLTTRTLAGSATAHSAVCVAGQELSRT